MLAAEAVISTENASRYLARLRGHADKMGHRLLGRPGAARHADGELVPRVEHAEWSDTHATVVTDSGRWTAQAAPGTLSLRVEAADSASLRRLQDMLGARLESLGRREQLTIDWQQT